MNEINLEKRSPEEAYMMGYEAGKRAAEKAGKWIDYKMGRWIYAKCAVCGTIQDVKSKYCPECGDRKNGTTTKSSA